MRNAVKLRIDRREAGCQEIAVKILQVASHAELTLSHATDITLYGCGRVGKLGSNLHTRRVTVKFKEALQTTIYPSRILMQSSKRIAMSLGNL